MEDEVEPSDEADPFEEREEERPRAARLGGRKGPSGPPRVPICLRRGLSVALSVRLICLFGSGEEDVVVAWAVADDECRLTHLQRSMGRGR